MPPFTQDAMGDVFAGDLSQLVFNSLVISRETEIPISATFNNIYVRPDQENLDLFIHNFKQIYDQFNVRIATIPHTTWVSSGQIQSAFPDLKIKNTILRNVCKANDIVNLAKSGFHYINLDRDIMRDKNALLEIKKAKDYCESIGKPVELSLLANEGCWGGCTVMDEHYHFNSTRQGKSPQFFMDPISTNSCSKWDIEDPSSALKAANLPPWREDWEEFLDLGIDVFKMHGRENMMRLKESMDIIERWAKEDELLFPEFDDYMDDLKVKDAPINLWREKIKTCKFDCWDCNYCESVVESHLKKKGETFDVEEYTQRCMDAIDNALSFKSNFVSDGYEIRGITSDRVRHFLNNLCSYDDSVYLELGTLMGSTFFAATMGNDIDNIGVDNYSDPECKPLTNNIQWNEVGNTFEEFKRYFNKYENGKSTFIKSDILDLKEEDFEGKKPNVVFYDANHDYVQQLNCLNHIAPFLADKFILIIDDANFDGVIESAIQFVKDNNYDLYFERKILSAIIENPTHWWNGLFVMVLEKQNEGN
tara:strand:- start:3292 stop:4893 length:1602 start_codon:yes stop_codon:yes gene_type:complete